MYRSWTIGSVVLTTPQTTDHVQFPDWTTGRGRTRVGISETRFQGSTLILCSNILAVWIQDLHARILELYSPGNPSNEYYVSTKGGKLTCLTLVNWNSSSSARS